MATGAKQTTSKPGLKHDGPALLSSPPRKSSLSSTRSSIDSFMTARTSATPTLAAPSSSRSSSTSSPRTPPPNSNTFIQEIDVFMENIGRLVNALEDQHRQRRFDVMWPGDAKGSASADPQRGEDRSRVSNKGVGGSTGASSTR